MTGDNSRYSVATAEIIKYLNVENAKICAFLMVIGFAVYHGLIHARYGGDSCDWLLSEGRFQGDNIWQPFGCMMHKYTTSEVKNCMHYISYWGGKNHIVFVGDSKVRQQYLELLTIVTGVEQETKAKTHGNLSYKNKNINLELEFLWHPVVNMSMYIQFDTWLHKPTRELPSVIITASGAWTMKLFNGTREGIDDYKLNLTALKPVLTKLGNSTKVIWMLQDPVDEKLCRNNSRSFITNLQIDSYNRAVEDVFDGTSVNVWSSSRKIAVGLPEDTSDGLHSGKVILSWDSQILVNLYCNDHMNFDDGTCCSSSEPITSLQIVTASFFGTCLLLSMCMFIWKRKKTSRQQNYNSIQENGFNEEEQDDSASSERQKYNRTNVTNSQRISDDQETDEFDEQYDENRQLLKDNENIDEEVHELDEFINAPSHRDSREISSGFLHQHNRHGSDPTSNCYNRNGLSNGDYMYPDNQTTPTYINRNTETNQTNYNQYNKTNLYNHKNSPRVGYNQNRGGGYNQNRGGGYNQNRGGGYSQNRGGYNQINGGRESSKSSSLCSKNSGDKNISMEKDDKKEPAGFYQLVVSSGRLGIIMMYFFLCDRTYFFMKENKYYTHVNFFLPFSYLMIVGFFFTETSQYTTVLHRDQTDEWKGWMQLVILIYHMTGASKVLSIYMQIRVLVSSYLFLSGYGHFNYFFVKGDFSLHRFCTVMFRFNFLVVLLCFTMNRPYQFYYFIPLVSFWFLVMYLTMGIWPQITAKSTDSNSLHYLYLILKFAVLVIAITLLYASEVLFENIFLSHPLKALFVTSDDSIHDWRFRWKIDRYSTVFGMAFAFALLLSKKLNFVVDSKAEVLFSRGLSWLVGVLAAAGLAGYFIFANFCRNKEECNEVHAYISFLPIISFIILRNLPGWLRVKYSSFFSWFGRIALELFISQYHMWLASDTHGILVLVPRYPVLNLTVTSFIFVCAAHEIHTVTGILVQYFVPTCWKSLLRNIILFFIVLLPVAITRGAFG